MVWNLSLQSESEGPYLHHQCSTATIRCDLLHHNLQSRSRHTVIGVPDQHRGARCPHLDALAGHVTEFAKILTARHGDRLDAWIAAAEADDQPDLHSFTTGLKQDHAAVLNGLTLPHSSGAVEGNVNRIKMIKRQMYGRAGFGPQGPGKVVIMWS